MPPLAPLANGARPRSRPSAPGAGGTAARPVPAASDPVRPAEDAIRRMVVRFAVALRVTCTAAAIVVVGVPAPLGVDATLLAAVAAAVVATTAGYAIVLLRRPGARWVVHVDLALAALICVLQGRLLPGDLGAKGSTWIAAAATMALVGGHLTLRPVAAWLGSLAVLGGWATGSTLAAGPGSGLPHLFMLLIQSAMAAAIMWLLTRSAQVADAALHERERARRAESVEAARRLDERLLRRRLHDTVLATLTMVGSGSFVEGSPTLCARAAEDLAVLLDLDPGTLPPGTLPPATTTGTSQAPPVRLDPRLDPRLAAAAERIRPLLDVAFDPVPCEAPEPVVAAFVAAVDELLVNVAKHAGVDEAAIRLRTDADAVVVEVVDRGAGFDPDRLSGPACRHRYGLRESVRGRMAEAGGWVRIRSAPGAGCTVTLGWPRG